MRALGETSLQLRLNLSTQRFSDESYTYNNAAFKVNDTLRTEGKASTERSMRFACGGSRATVCRRFSRHLLTSFTKILSEVINLEL